MDGLQGSAREHVQILNPDDGFHYFFGYYDLRAASTDGKHLCHRVKFMDRLPGAQEEAELGWLDKGEFHPFAMTTAWNFQQGAMLQYHPVLADTVYYNVCEGGRFQTVTHNYRTGEKQYADRASACISPDGKWGLGINFGRIFAFRPGYGYAGFADPYAEVNAPEEDGVFLVDLRRGTSRLLLSYAQLAPLGGFTAEDKVLVNHITFNPASDSFILLLRNFPKEGGSWSTSLLWSDLDGNVRPILKNTYFSHYDWVADDALIAHCTVEANKKSMYRINTAHCTWEELDMPYFHEEGNRDIHCRQSPDMSAT